MHGGGIVALIVSTHLFSPTIMAADAPSSGVHVLHAEPVSINFEATTIAGRKSALSAGTATENRTAKFDALGRSFVVNVELHTELNDMAKRLGATAVALRGTLVGQAASWVRLTQTGEHIRGLMWDGHELLVIEPASELPTAVDSPNVVKPNVVKQGSMIFRLADTVIDTTANTCAALTTVDSNATGASSGAAFYQNLNRELKSALSVTTQAADQSVQTGATRRLQVSALMDAQYLLRYASLTDANDALIARINNVDGIFTAQLGIHIELTSASAASASNGVLSQSLIATELLQSLAKLRAANAPLYGTGVTHLFTGRDLEGRTVGISYVGAVCSQTYGVALSEVQGRTAWYESLIVAHELAHSFGAGHDGEGDCASVPNTYLMAPMIGDSDHFSQCSLDHMQKQIAQASCLLPILQPDLAMAANLGEQRAAVADTFDWSMTATNLGEGRVVGGKVQITVPAQLTVQSARIDNGQCITGAGVVDCDLGQVDAHALRNISLSLQATLSGTYQISATVSSDLDANFANNSGHGSVVIESPQPPVATATPTSTANTPAITATQPSSASQGGGAMELSWLLALVSVLYWRRRYPPIAA